MAGMIDCEDIMRQALGRDMNEAEIEEFFREGDRLWRQVKAARNAANQGAAAKQAAQRWAQKQQLAAIAKKRAVNLQMEKRLNAVRYALREFKGMEAEGVAAILVGSKFARAGARLSVDSISRSLEGTYIAGFINDLNRLGKAHFEMLRKGEMDREIAIAMWSIDNPNAQPYHGPKIAMEIAEVLHKWSERARMDQNMAGAWIAKEPGYIVRQSHDPAKLKKAGYLEWKREIENRLDWAATAEGRYDPAGDPVAADDFLRETYKSLVTGVHPRQLAEDVSPLTRTGTIGSTAARASKERVLRFKSGADWFDYNAKFGYGSLREAYVAGLGRAARNTGLMRVLGPSPQANFNNILKDIELTLQRRFDEKGIRRLNNKREELKNFLKEVDGTLDIDGSPTKAAIGRYIRATESMAKLGGALISSGADIPNYAWEMAYQGQGFLKSLAEGLGYFVQGRGSLEQQQILAQCEVFFDSMCGALAARFYDGGMPGKTTALLNLYFRANGLTFWTECWKKAACLQTSHGLAQMRGLDFGALGKAQRRLLSLYGIDEGRWELLRKGKTLAADGRDYLTPEAAYDATDADITAYMTRSGQKATQARVEQFRDDLAEKLRTLIRDRVQYAVLEPDARSNALWRRGQSAGTVVGEVLRFVAQFKSFPTVFLQRTFAREIYGRGTDKFWRGVGEGLVGNRWFGHNSGGEAGHLAGVVLMMTLFGYGAMTAKQLLAGKTPRPFADPRTWMAAALQGGALGIYGDFLFAEKSRMGSSFYSTLGGPFLGSVEGAFQLYQRMRDGMVNGEPADVKSEAFRWFFNQMPGNNLFWFRAAFDHQM